MARRDMVGALPTPEDVEGTPVEEFYENHKLKGSSRSALRQLESLGYATISSRHSNHWVIVKGYEEGALNVINGKYDGIFGAFRLFGAKKRKKTKPVKEPKATSATLEERATPTMTPAVKGASDVADNAAKATVLTGTGKTDSAAPESIDAPGGPVEPAAFAGVTKMYEGGSDTVPLPGAAPGADAPPVPGAPIATPGIAPREVPPESIIFQYKTHPTLAKVTESDFSPDDDNKVTCGEVLKFLKRFYSANKKTAFTDCVIEDLVHSTAMPYEHVPHLRISLQTAVEYVNGFGKNALPYSGPSLEDISAQESEPAASAPTTIDPRPAKRAEDLAEEMNGAPEGYIRFGDEMTRVFAPLLKIDPKAGGVGEIVSQIASAYQNHHGFKQVPVGIDQRVTYVRSAVTSDVLSEILGISPIEASKKIQELEKGRGS